MDANVFSVSMAKELSQNRALAQDMDEPEDNFDTFNDETFGAMDSTDWESEHEKLTSLSVPNDHNDSHSDSNRSYSFVKNSTFAESRAEDDMRFGYENIVKSISNLGLEDEDFDDPAVMTFGRSAKPLGGDTSRRDSRSSPPPPAILSYEEYSASPKTQTIWSATQLDSTHKPTNTSTNMRTLEEIEDNMINRNNSHSFPLSTIKRPIRMEDLESNMINESNNSHMTSNQMPVPDNGWSPFAANSMQSFIQNGRIGSEMMPNVETIEHNLLTNESPNRHNSIDMNAIHSAARLALSSSQETNESVNPLLKAQTLDDIERQLMSGQSSPPKRQTAPNTPKSEPPVPMMRPNPSPNIQSPNRPMNQQLNQMRPHMLVQNRMNNMYNRPPVMHLMPGMHPAMGRTMFSPALIPNSQRIIPFPLQSRPIMHPLLNPMQLQYQRHPMYHNNNSQQRHQNRYHENYDNEDEYSGLMTQREKEWLIKIQQFQTELKDPYVDDYYYVTFISRKIAAKAANNNEKTKPSLLLPERPKPATESETAKYIPEQFEGTLGKIQVSNVNCPRKLLDCNINKTTVAANETTGDSKVVVTKSEVQKFRKLLLHIEKLYVVLINIDDEDKRIGALPPDAQIPHIETRNQLSDKLFKGLTNETNDKINSDVIQIKKGLLLVFRSLCYLSDENQRAVIISDLLYANNYKQYILKSKTRVDFGVMLVNAIRDINNHDVILKIVSNINNISILIKSEYGKAIIESFIKQSETLQIKEENKSKWSKFVNYVLEEVVDDSMPELTTLCRKHLTHLEAK